MENIMFDSQALWSIAKALHNCAVALGTIAFCLGVITIIKLVSK